MKKKALAIILATTISLTGCSSTKEVNSNETEEIETSSETEIETETESETESTNETEQDNNEEIDASKFKLIDTNDADDSVIDDFEEYDFDTVTEAFNTISTTDEADKAKENFRRLHHMTAYIYATTCDSFSIVKHKISDIPIEDLTWVDSSIIQKLKVIQTGNTNVDYIGEQNGLYFYCIDTLAYDEAYSISSYNDREYNGHEIDILINSNTLDNDSFITKIEVDTENGGGNEKCISITNDGLATTSFRYDRPANQLISMLTSSHDTYDIMLNGTRLALERVNDDIIRAKNNIEHDTDVNIRVYNDKDASLSCSLTDTLGFSIIKNNNEFNVGIYEDKIKPFSVGTNSIIEKEDIQYSFQLAGYYDSENYASLKEQSEDFNKKSFLTYDEYAEFCRYWGLEQKFTDETKTYAVYSEMWRGVMNFEVDNVALDKNAKTIKISIKKDNWGATGDILGAVVVIPVQENEYENIEVEDKYTSDELNLN